MKQILLILAVVALVGCGEKEVWHTQPKQNIPTIPANTQVADNNSTWPVRKLTAAEEKIVGSYENKFQIDEKYTIQHVLLENGNRETYWNGEKGDGKWKLVGNEVHFISNKNYSKVYKIEPDGNLKLISEIEKGKRLDYQKEDQLIYKKLK